MNACCTATLPGRRATSSSVAQSEFGDGASGRLEREMRRLDRSDRVERRDLAPRLGKLAGDADAQAMGETILTASQLVDRALDGTSAKSFTTA